MSLKDDIKAVKNELNTEEQFLESMIKMEIVVKKYKVYMIVAAVALVGATVGYNVKSYMETECKIEANSAYMKLQSDPKNQSALDTLKDKNIKLYNLHLMQTSIEDGKSIDKSSLDEIQKSLITYYEASNSQNIEKLASYANSDNSLLREFSTLQEGYLFLKQKNAKTANIKFAQIPINSPLKEITNSLIHYK